jgi:hypothetical protein
MRKFLSILIFICIYSFSFIAGTQAAENQSGKNESVSNLQLERAIFVNGNIQFSGQNKFDWKSLVPDKIQSIKTGVLFREDLVFIKTGKQYGENSPYYQFEFDKPIQGGIGQQYFYMISNTGVEEIRPTSLKVTARFELTETGGLMEDPIYYGELITKVLDKSKISDGGFVISSQTPLKISTFADSPSIRQAFSARYEGKELVYTYNFNNRLLKLNLEITHLDKIVTIYNFKQDGVNADYIFVKWGPDNDCFYACCANSYSLFRAEQELQELMWNLYNCDV